MQSIIKTINILGDIEKTALSFDLPHELLEHVRQAKYDLKKEIETEITDLRSQAKTIFNVGHNRYISGSKPTEIKRILKSAKEFQDDADKLETLLKKL